MSNKRPAPQVHASRRGQVPGEPKRKRRKPDNAGPKSFKKAHPVNELKSRIRSIGRLLDRDDKLPATIRVEKERELQTAQYELEQTQRAKDRSDIIGRYHKARFFDKQKATKRLKRARKELRACEEGGEGDVAQLEERVREGEVDVNYAQYFPLEQHYVSLFPRKKTEGDAEEGPDDDQQKDEEPLQKGDLEMRQRVKQCMVEETLEDLRHGRLDREDKRSQQAPFGGMAGKTKRIKGGGKKSGGSAPSLSQHPVADEEMPDDDEESDGGFFE